MHFKTLVCISKVYITIFICLQNPFTGRIAGCLGVSYRVIVAIVILDRVLSTIEGSTAKRQVLLTVVGLLTVVLAKQSTNRVALRLINQIAGRSLTARNTNLMTLLIKCIALRCLELLDGVIARRQQAGLGVTVLVGGQFGNCLVRRVVHGVLSAGKVVAIVAIGDRRVGRGLVDLNPTAEVLDERNLCGDVLVADEPVLVAILAVGGIRRGDVQVVNDLARLHVHALQGSGVGCLHVAGRCRRAVCAVAGCANARELTREVRQCELSRVPAPGRADPASAGKGPVDIRIGVGERNHRNVGNGPLRLNDHGFGYRGVEVVLLAVLGVPTKELPTGIGRGCRCTALDACVGLALGNRDLLLGGLAAVVGVYGDGTLGLYPGALHLVTLVDRCLSP